MKVVFWGTYDVGKPRNRILIRGLQENNVNLIECHSHIWQGVEDKSQLKKASEKLRFIARWLLSYPGLIVRYLFLPKHDLVIVGYLGQLDVLVLWPFARLRGAKIVWDAFLSLHDTVVNDRKILSGNNLAGRLLYWWEWLACRAVDMVVLDTDSHREFFEHHFNIPFERTGAVFVGVEPKLFPSQTQNHAKGNNDFLELLFYGQFIPLHGIPVIIKAARLLQEEKIRFTIIGEGQESARIAGMMKEQSLEKVRFISWVLYEELHNLISQADICLGIFGDSQKAERVIPNKVFQIIQSGKPLITRDTKAIRELLNPEMEGVFLVSGSLPEELAGTLKQIQRDEKLLYPEGQIYMDIISKIQPKAIGSRMIAILKKTVSLAR